MDSKIQSKVEIIINTILESMHLKEECIDLTDDSVSARYPYNIQLEE